MQRPDYASPHPWRVSIPYARNIQSELAREVLARDLFGDIRLVAGLDIGFEDGGRITRAAVVVLRFPELTRVESVLLRRPTCWPYVPGLLSFRELPAALDAFLMLDRVPDLVLCDGQGVAHPRRCGLASHLGVITGLPTIGVAKSRLIGEAGEPGPRRGDMAPLIDRGERIGMVLRTRDHVRPVYVSVGHKVSLERAVELVLACTPKYRLPETTRQAHHLASVFRSTQSPAAPADNLHEGGRSRAIGENAHAGARHEDR